MTDLIEKLLEGLELEQGIDSFLLALLKELLELSLEDFRRAKIFSCLQLLLARILSPSTDGRNSTKDIEEKESYLEASQIVDELTNLLASHTNGTILLGNVKSIAAMIATCRAKSLDNPIEPSCSPPVLLSDETPAVRISQIPSSIASILILPRFGMKLRQDHRLEWLQFFRDFNGHVQSLPKAPSPAVWTFPTGRPSWRMFVISLDGAFHFSWIKQDPFGLEIVKDLMKKVEPGITWNSRKLVDKDDELIWTTEAERYGFSQQSRTLLTTKSSPNIWVVLHHSKQNVHSPRAKRQRGLNSRVVSSSSEELPLFPDIMAPNLSMVNTTPFDSQPTHPPLSYPSPFLPPLDTCSSLPSTLQQTSEYNTSSIMLDIPNQWPDPELFFQFSNIFFDPEFS